MVIYACPQARRTVKKDNTKRGLLVAGLSLGDLFSYSPVEYESNPPNTTLDGNREWVRAQLLKMTSIPTPSDTGAVGIDADPNFRSNPSPQNPSEHIKQDAAGLLVDKNTLKWKSWVGENPEDADVDPPDATQYKITQSDYRRFNSQVRDTGYSTSVRQRGSGFKEECISPTLKQADMMMTYEGKMVPSLPCRQGVYVIRPAGSRTLAQCGTYAIPNPFPPQKYITNNQGETTPVIHRSQLATSFRAFQEKKWRPYEGVKEPPEGGGGTRASSRVSSRPSSSTSARSEQRFHERNSSRPPSGSAARRIPGNPGTFGRPSSRPHSVIGGDNCSHGHDHGTLSNEHLHQSPSRYDSITSPIQLTSPRSLRDSQRDLSTLEGQGYYLDSFSQTQTQHRRNSSNGQLAPLQNMRMSMTPAATEITGPADGCAGQYDTLTPEIVYQLSTGPRPLSVYGAKPVCYPDEYSYQKNGEKSSETNNGTSEDEQRQEPSPSSAKRDTDSTSGIGTDKDSDVEDEDDDGDRDSNDSDDERIPEPKLEDIRMADLPKLNLRPEQLDAFYIPDERHDRRKYDFDSNKCERIPFEFEDALSSPLMALDLHQISISERGWRAFAKGPAPGENEEKIVERLLELEKLQRKTKDIENMRKDRLRSAHVRARTKIGTTLRQQSAKMGERKCCSDCLQVACVGDCPGKKSALQRLGSSNCLICAEKSCNGKCCESAYDARSRQTRVMEEEPRKNMKFRPKSCVSCTSKNPAKVNNANNIILGRPKSSYSTFSSSQSGMRPARDLRSKSGSFNQNVEEEFERLGIDNQPVKDVSAGDQSTTSATRRKLKGRASQLPGKSFFSQRRHSLTDIAKEIRVKSANKKRLKSPKKSQKTDGKS